MSNSSGASCGQKVVKFIFQCVAPFFFIPLLALAAPFYRLLDKFTFEWFQSRRFLITRAEHRVKVERVQAQVKAWGSSSAGAGAGRPRRRMCTAKPAWNSWSLRWINKRELTGINVSHLNAVVDVDEVSQTVTVEPGVMMGQLTSILIPRGWTIPLVPEFETLTVGGTICGTGVESNGTRVGFSGDTAIEYEIVIADGSVLTCSASENEDLFYTIPWSHGTLGFLTAVKFPLVPSKKYVRLEYHRTEDPSEARRLLETEDHEFVEGLAFGPRAFVVTYGDMSDNPSSGRATRAANSPPTRVNHINRWYKPLFFKHVESFLKKPVPKSQLQDGAGAREPMGATAAPCPLAVDYIPLRDYYHRHTRGYFWAAVTTAPYLKSPLFLALFGWILPMADFKIVKRLFLSCPSCVVGPAYKALAAFNFNVQDFVLPMRHFETTLNFVHETVEVYPMWLCPTRFFRKPGFAHVALDSEHPSELYVDVGVYGQSIKTDLDYQEATEKMEQFTIDHGGVQFLYADSFLTSEQFRRMFDLSLYDKVRVKYGADEAFPDVYDKVSSAARGLEKKPETNACTAVEV